MRRITLDDLAVLTGRINLITQSPDTTWVMKDGNLKAQKGNYGISQAYGGVSLHQIVTNGGGERDVFNCGHVSKRELFNLMHAYIRGLQDCETRLSK